MTPKEIALILEIDLYIESWSHTAMFERFCDAQAFAELCDEFTMLDIVITSGRNHSFANWSE